MAKRELKTIEINNKQYTYTELETPERLTFYDTTFVQVSVNANYKDMFDSIGGFTRDVLYNPMKDLDVDQLTILSIPTKRYSLLTQFIYEKDGMEVHHVTTVEDLFLGHVIEFLTKNTSIVGNFDVQNSLTYMDDEKYAKYFEDYQQPTSVNQSGLYYGEEAILFGESFTITGLTNIQDILQGDLLRAVKDGGVDSLDVQVKDAVGGFNMVTNEVLKKKDGTVYTYFDDDLAQLGKTLTREEFIDSEVKSYFKYRGSKSEEQYRLEVEKEMDEPYVILLTRESINTLLNLDNVSVQLH